MTLPSSKLTSAQQAQETTCPTQHVVVQKKLPFRQPQIGPLRHLLQATGQGGSSSQYDSYSDNRP